MVQHAILDVMMATDRQTRAAIYAGVSTTDQTCENQLLELRRYCQKVRQTEAAGGLAHDE
jgi:hypothetical protein